MTPGVAWVERALTRHHDRAGFDCSIPALNEYLPRYARLDAKDDRAAAWHERFGARRLLDDRLKLVLPLEVIAAALKK